MVQLSQPYMTTGKTIALTIWTFISKMMSNEILRNRILLGLCIGGPQTILTSSFHPVDMAHSTSIEETSITEYLLGARAVLSGRDTLSVTKPFFFFFQNLREKKRIIDPILQVKKLRLRSLYVIGSCANTQVAKDRAGIQTLVS